jgi:hypothetical protein
MKFRTDVMRATVKLLGEHDKLLRLPPNATRSTQVWHLLVSLREFCVYSGLSFDDILASVKEHEEDCSGGEAV